MINSYKKNGLLLKKGNRKSALKMVILPFLGLISLVIMFSILVFSQISVGQQSISSWTNISIIIILIFLIIPGSFLMVLILGSIIVINKSIQPIQLGLWKLQHYVILSSEILLYFAKILLTPFIYLESTLKFIQRPKP
jgi:hypothetical protein